MMIRYYFRGYPAGRRRHSSPLPSHGDEGLKWLFLGDSGDSITNQTCTISYKLIYSLLGILLVQHPSTTAVAPAHPPKAPAPRQPPTLEPAHLRPRQLRTQ